jgi:hypothetical protein
MSISKRRLDKLEVSLTPKQAILLWMEEAHQYDSMREYCLSLKPGPDSAWPLAILPDKVSKAVEQAMKGRPKPAVARTVRQAIRDVLFLFHLHQQVNQKFMEEDRHYWTRALLLSVELDALRRERFLRDQMTWNWFRVGMELPYPLDSETVATVEAVKEHYVLTWELLEEGDQITGWVQDYSLAQGKPELPYRAYSLRDDSKFRSTTAPSEDEVRALFAEETDFQKFLAGEDYEYGLAGVSDQEFEAKWDAVFQAVIDLVALGEVEEGMAVELPTVPHSLLRDAPLVDGEWLDRYVVTLAEWGARLRAKGYLLQEPEDSHPMAWYRIVDPETGAEVDVEVMKQLWQQTEKHLGRFPGHTRDIQGRLYLHFQDYIRWRGRKAKGDFQAGLRRGLVLSSWNCWVAANGDDGSATLEGVKVSCLSSYLEGYRYHHCRDEDEVAVEKRRRESLLQDLRGWKPGSHRDQRYHRRINDWKEMARDFLCELCSLRHTADAMSHRYFDGHQVPFPVVAEEFARLIGCLKVLVEEYNEGFANELGQETHPASEGLEPAKPPNFVDIAALEEAVAPAARQHMAFLVDMARAETLDAMGENRAAVDIMERYIEGYSKDLVAKTEVNCFE